MWHLAILPRGFVDLILSSQSLRFAILSVAWRLGSGNERNRATQSAKALHRCYPLFRESLSQPPKIESFYTCFALFRFHFLLNDLDGALVHLSGMVKIVRALKAQNFPITDAEWSRMESRLMNSVSMTEQLSFANYHYTQEKPINVLAEGVHRILHAISLDIDMVEASHIQYRRRDLQNRLTMLSLHINFLFLRYLEPESQRNGCPCRSRRMTIASQLLPLVREFCQLLLRYDPRVGAFVNFTSDDWLWNMRNQGLTIPLHRIESYCLASFLQRILLDDRVNRNDSEIHSLGLVCFRAIEIQVKATYPWPGSVFSFFLAWILLPASKFAYRSRPVSKISDRRICADEDMVRK